MGNCCAATGFPLCSRTSCPSRTVRRSGCSCSGEKLIAFRDTKGRARPDRRVLRASRRLAVVRPQRGLRPALPLPRLEVRRDRPMRRPAVGGRRSTGCREPHQAEEPTLHRAGRRRSGPTWGRRSCSPRRRRSNGRWSRPAQRFVSQATAGVQLPAGDGRRHRFQPRLLPARRDAERAIRCSRARRATSTTSATACRCSRSRNSTAAC